MENLGEPEYPTLHASEKLFDSYNKVTLKTSSAQNLINLDIIINIPIAKLDINQFRYNPNSDFRNFGYTTTNELLDDLDKVITQAKNLKQKFLSKFANKVTL
ncbi:hypothetical protein THII_2860 [Thioploca ingrica]|uniref:Uncharacterized protein n=1 Tax=Thioploca ingrica TaxID=40754 RepID=A0A090AMF8_9GAMM|nr:hypothetical protein THII_2860 [Thioploca ingrica]